MRPIVFAGGATGGHLTPAVAIAERLPEDQPTLLIGCGRPIEIAMAKAAGMRHFALPHDAGRDGEHAFTRLRHLREATVAARRLLRESNAAAVVGLGGYASIPTVTAAADLGLPITLLEQNAVPGRATELLAPLARRTLAAMPLALPRVEVIGNPIRRTIAEAVRRETDPPTLLILGGSQGSDTLNSRLPKLIGTSKQTNSIVHQCGPGNEDAVRDAYRACGHPVEVVGFADDLASRLASASVVISRAGGSSLAEFAAVGLPTVLIPIAGSLRDHQVRNADFAARYGAETVAECDLDSKLVPVVTALLADRRLRDWRSAQLKRLLPDNAAAQCVDRISNDLQARRGAA